MKETLRWLCKNALNGCNWARNFEPVEGWDATPTVTYDKMPSYMVHKCPEFDRKYEHLHRCDIAEMFGISEYLLGKKDRREIYTELRKLTGNKIVFDEESKRFYRVME